MLGLYLQKEPLSKEDAFAAMQQALRLMESKERVVDSLRVIELTTFSKCTAYDCEFVALAQELGVNLIALDRQILEQSLRQQFRWMILSSSKRLCGE